VRGPASGIAPEADPRLAAARQPRRTQSNVWPPVARASARSPFARRNKGEVDRVSWQHRGNIHIVSNPPDRPRNPAVAGNLDLPGHYVRPASKVEGLVGGFPRGSSSLPGRTSSVVGVLLTFSRSDGSGVWKPGTNERQRWGPAGFSRLAVALISTRSPGRASSLTPMAVHAGYGVVVKNRSLTLAKTGRSAIDVK
jgi:hypothetical protein